MAGCQGAQPGPCSAPWWLPPSPAGRAAARLAAGAGCAGCWHKPPPADGVGLRDPLHESPRRVHLRSRAVCFVANARNSGGYCCALRLAVHPDPQRTLPLDSYRGSLAVAAQPGASPRVRRVVFRPVLPIKVLRPWAGIEPATTAFRRGSTRLSYQWWHAWSRTRHFLSEWSPRPCRYPALAMCGMQDIDRTRRPRTPGTGGADCCPNPGL
jgi:hypothetical protein